MARIARLIGGAGTGKTTELLSIMAKTIEAGVSPYDIGFVSFTRAARGEAAERAAKQFGVSRETLEKEAWFKTLHAVCYKCLGDSRGKLLTGDAEGRKWLQEALQVDVGRAGGEEDFSEAFGEGFTEAGCALRLWDAARNRLESLEDVWREAAEIDERTPAWESVKALVERYELHKTLDNRCDFVDLAGKFAGWKFGIEAHDETKPDGQAPDLPVWFFDEQQDTSRLLDSVCRRLISGPSCRWVYVVGDPYQSIYGWAGANADCFREWEAEKERIMPQSFRCPAEVMRLGEEALQDCSDYFDRGIAPAGHAGAVDYSWWHPGLAGEVDPCSSWLLLARTNRLAMQLASALDKQGIPWAPTKGLGGWAAPKRLAAFTAIKALADGNPIARDEWRTAIDLIPARDESGPLLVRGAKSQWADKNFKPATELATVDALTEWGATEELQERIKSGEWTGLVDGAERFVAAVDRWGYEAVKEPRVRVGTVHSVKGSEADNVLLLTTSTHQCARAMENQRMADEERRVVYVGITRARRRLIVAKERNARFRMPMP
jgi:DNA helicase-2/ATP-dependent DNA helicase PcrA